MSYHHDLLSLEFFHFQLVLPPPCSYLSILNPCPLSCLSWALSGSRLHAVEAAVGLRLATQAAQTVTGKPWIESKGEEAQTDTHHKAAECPAWPQPHPLKRTVVEEIEATAFMKSSEQPACLHLPWSSLAHHIWARKGSQWQKSHPR